MAERILCDTCVLIDFVNGRNQHLAQLHQQGASLFTNPVIELELLQGARNKDEMQYLEKKLRMFRQLDMPGEIFQVARELIKIYALSHGLRLADALIAATALVYEFSGSHAPAWESIPRRSSGAASRFDSSSLAAAVA